MPLERPPNRDAWFEQDRALLIYEDCAKDAAAIAFGSSVDRPSHLSNLYKGHEMPFRCALHKGWA